MAESILLSRQYLFAHARTPIRVMRIDDQEPTLPHQHEFAEIIFILSGSGVHETGQFRHQIHPGDVMVIRRRRSHAYRDTRALNLINLLVSEPILENIASHLGSLPGFHSLFTFEFTRWEQKDFQQRLCLNAADLRTACADISMIEEELAHGGEAGSYLARARLSTLLALLARRYGTRSRGSQNLDQRLGQVLSGIDADPAAPRSLPEMARAAAMSERSFQRYFQKATGTSPATYLLRKRIQLAEPLLRDHSQPRSLTDIAFLCGFNDSNYLSRQFKKLHGISPREYRNKHR